MKKLLPIILIFFLFSCDRKTKVAINESEILQEAKRLKEQDENNLKELKRYNRLDSLSEYEFSGMKKFVDSIKVNDSIKYFALKRVMERDTINNYNEKSFALWFVDKIKTDEFYKKQAKKILNEKSKKNE